MYGLWDKKDGEYILPKQLHKFKDDMVVSVSVLMNYLKNSGDVVLCWNNPDLPHEQTYMPESVFTNTMKDWCKRNGHTAPVWNSDNYGQTFNELNISRVQDSKEWEGQQVFDYFLLGVSINRVNM